MKKEKEIKIVFVEPNKAPVIKIVKNDLSVFQEMVGGYIECIYLNDANLVCNDEGKLIPLPPNRYLIDDKRFCDKDAICGNFFIVGDDNKGNFKSLTDKECVYWCDYFKDIPLNFEPKSLEPRMEFIPW